MSIGCDRDFGLSPEFSQIEKEMTIWAKIHKFPLNVTYELTPFCNFKCPMCYVRLDPARAAKQGKMMSGKQWLEIMRQTKEMGALFVTLTGGEPFMHPDFWEIYEGAVEMGMLVTIYSNASLINERIVERLKKNPPHNMKLSLYGTCNETYERMCGVKDGFDKVSRAIDLLKEADLPFFCTATIIKDNMEELAEFYRFAAEKQIPFFHTAAVANTQRDAIADPLAVRISDQNLRWSLEGLEQARHKPATDPFAACPPHGIAYFMTWHGRMQFCGFAAKPYTQLGDPINVAETWKAMCDRCDTIRIPDACADCLYAEFCRRCPGVLAAESGDPEQVCESFCSQARDMYELYHQLKAAKEAEQSQETSED
jgi:MoaA/NifB/PqqE/SkfB family radical SAM enzyme